jgi:hypothetical protein
MHNDRMTFSSSLRKKYPYCRSFGRLILFVLLIGLVFLSPRSGYLQSAVAHSPDAATITFSPSPVTIAGCDSVLVNVMVNDVVNLYGADVQISFDPAVLEVVDANPTKPGVQVLNGGFLVKPWILYDTANNTTGVIHFVATQINPTPPANGTGILITINFRARTAATSSSLNFTFTQLADREGATIPASATHSTANIVAPAAPVINISKLNSTDARLSWTAIPGISSYRLYRDTLPYFTPVTPYQTTTSIQYDDLGALGDVAVNHFYVVRSACVTGFESVNSGRVGEFDFTIVRDAYNTIALPLMDSTTLTADDLGIAVNAQQVSQWVASTQSFDTRLVGWFGNNFALSTGSGYLVYTPGSGATIFTTVGGVSNVSFPITRAANCQLNLISLPLNQGSILTADGLANAIGGVPLISEWQAATGSFDTRMVGFFGNNFATRLGYPYWPCADNSESSPVWP